MIVAAPGQEVICITWLMHPIWVLYQSDERPDCVPGLATAKFLHTLTQRALTALRIVMPSQTVTHTRPLVGQSTLGRSGVRLVASFRLLECT